MAQEIGPVFSHDGRSVVYSSSRGGQPELYVAPRERPGEARRLPGTANSVLGQQFTWDDRAVLFTADRNGDERWRILRADLTTGEVIDLTPTPLNAQGFTLPEGAPDTVFCAGLDMASGSSTIYALPATRPGEPRIRKSLDAVIEKHIDSKTVAEQEAERLRLGVIDDALPARTRELLGLPASNEPTLPQPCRSPTKRSISASYMMRESRRSSSARGPWRA